MNVLSFKQIAEITAGKLFGDELKIISGAAALKFAQKNEISFLDNLKYLAAAKNSKAGLIIVPETLTEELATSYLKVKNPKIAFAKVLGALYQIPCPEKGIHTSAVVAENVILSKNTAVGALSYIGKNSKIGEDTIIFPQVFIGENCKIGNNCLIFPQVVVRENITIGNNVIIHSGSVIGSDGFGFEKLPDGTHFKIPQIGTIIIEDNVEIGANNCIDRATLGITKIGKGTKTDNLVQIAHNITIGENCIIVAQVGIGGSTEIGNNVFLLGQAGLKDHIKVGDNTIICAQAGVTKDVPANSIYSGYPAAPHKEQKKLNYYLNKLPEIFKDLEKLQKLLPELEKLINKDK